MDADGEINCILQVGVYSAQHHTPPASSNRSRGDYCRTWIYMQYVGWGMLSHSCIVSHPAEWTMQWAEPWWFSIFCHWVASRVSYIQDLYVERHDIVSGCFRYHQLTILHGFGGISWDLQNPRTGASVVDELAAMLNGTEAVGATKLDRTTGHDSEEYVACHWYVSALPWILLCNTLHVVQLLQLLYL